jgi:tetratricopeptide (TPR) repeat protein
MKLLLLQFVILGLATAAFANDEQFFFITTNQAASVKKKLEAYEKGVLHLRDLTENAGTEGCRELIGYYLLHTNDISVKAKIPISRTFAAGEMYPQAIKLAQEYVNVYSNDWLGWSLLGYYYSSINYSNEAINGYSNAVRLGDKDSYEPLAGNALKYGRTDVVKNIVPQLMALKESKQTPEENKLNLISMLLFYSAKTDQKNIFIQTLKGEDMGKILKDDAVKKNIISGCAFFEDEDTNKDIEKIRQEMESATSSTNSVSSPPR